MSGPHSRSGLGRGAGISRGLSNAPCDGIVGACANPLVLAQATVGGSPFNSNNPVLKELCAIFCKTRKEWQACRSSGRKDCEKPSKTAARRTKAQLDNPRSGLNGAVKDLYPKGVGRAEKSFLAVVDDAAAKALKGARKVYDENALKRALERKLKAFMKKEAIDLGVRRAKSWWKKFVPGLNIISTIIDVADAVITGAEIVKMIRNMSGIADNAIRIQPDFAVEGPDGRVQDIYDYKFDAPKTDDMPAYQDDWQKANKQRDAYKKSMNGREPIPVNKDTCQCDPKPKKPPMLLG